MELQLALDHGLQIIPILRAPLKWEDLNAIKLFAHSGEPFQLGGMKGLPYVDDVDAFVKDLYDYIYQMKRKINLYDKEQMQVDIQQLNLKDHIDNLLESNEFRAIIKNNLSVFKALSQEITKKNITLFEYLFKVSYCVKEILSKKK